MISGTNDKQKPNGSSVSLREYVDTRFEASEKAVAVALAATERAVAAAAQAQKEAAAESKAQALEIRSLSASRSVGEGRSGMLSTAGVTIGNVITIGIALLAIVAATIIGILVLVKR